MAGPITDMQWPRYAGVTQGWLAIHVVHAFSFSSSAKAAVERWGDEAEASTMWMMFKQAQTNTTPYML